MEWIGNPEIWIALATLTALEIVLGVDNIIFISILAGKLPHRQQGRARRVGLFGAMFMRIGLLLSLSWMVGLTRPLFALFDHSISGRDLILLTGGLFLLGKSTWEIHENLEGGVKHRPAATPASLLGVIVQNGDRLLCPHFCIDQHESKDGELGHSNLSPCLAGCNPL